MRHPSLGAERRQIEQLSAAPGTEREKPGEGPEIPDGPDEPRVALDVRAHVAVKPARRVETAIVDQGVQPGEGKHLVERPQAWTTERTLVAGEGLFPVVRFQSRTADQLRHGERQKLEHRRPSGQGLADMLVEQEVLGTREDEGTVPALISGDLQIREQVRHALDLVQDRAPLPPEP